ncbi:MAG: hypothetical protein ACP5NS_03705 [Candidatus Pacearchaeota archaeon]
MEVKERILELRNAIRYARNQVGDDRCWIDYWRGYRLLQDTDTSQLTLPDRERGMQICTSFYRFRKQAQSRIPRKIMSEQRWDEDLEEKSEPFLKVTLEELEMAWRKHRDTQVDQLTIGDDLSLYKQLPEHLHTPRDFRLPPRNEFLGTAKDCAGCPNFWTSHANCKSEHNPHAWGPCNIEV